MTFELEKDVIEERLDQWLQVLITIYKLCTYMYVVHKRDNLHLDQLMSLQSKTVHYSLKSALFV